MGIDRGDTNDVIRQRLAGRIKQRREHLDMTQAQLAHLAHMHSAQIISSIERGERDVKAVELAAIASAMYCDLTDLFAEPERPAVVAWRERPDDGASLVEARFLRLCMHYRLAEEWTGEERECELPAVNPPRGAPSFQWARIIAGEVHAVLDLGMLPATSLLRTLEERCGVKIFHFPDLRGSAACARGDFGAAIALNASEVPWRRNFSLAHELFHLVTWDYLGPESADEHALWSGNVEKLANTFASSLLLPETQVRDSLAPRLDGRTISWRSLAETAREFDVSTEALLWRLVSLEMLSERGARRLLDDPDFHNIDRATFTRVQDVPQLPDRFLRLLETAYLRGDVSAGRVAEMTEQNLGDVHHWLSRLEEDEVGGERLVRLA